MNAVKLADWITYYPRRRLLEIRDVKVKVKPLPDIPEEYLEAYCCLKEPPVWVAVHGSTVILKYRGRYYTAVLSKPVV